MFDVCRTSTDWRHVTICLRQACQDRGSKSSNSNRDVYSLGSMRRMYIHSLAKCVQDVNTECTSLYLNYSAFGSAITNLKSNSHKSRAVTTWTAYNASEPNEAFRLTNHGCGEDEVPGLPLLNCHRLLCNSAIAVWVKCDCTGASIQSNMWESSCTGMPL